MPFQCSLAALLPCVLLVAAPTDDIALATWPTFDHALCTCGNLGGTTSPLTVVGYDSGRDAELPAAPIGVGGNLHGSVALHTSGPLYVSGNAASRVGTMQVGDDLFMQGALNTSGNLAVNGNAWLGGDTKVGGTMQVKGDVTLSPNAHLRVAHGQAPSTTSQAFDVQPPCNCTSDASALILQRIRAAARDNDNKVINMPPDFLHNPQHTVRLLLPTGDYYLTSIVSADPVTLVADGEVDLYIAGDIVASAELHIVSARGGHLEVFVAGNVNVGPNFFFGNTRVPGHARLYVAGKSLNTGGALNVAGNIYAPHADVMLSSKSHLRGSGWFNTLSHNAPVSITYDPAVLRD